MNKSSPSAQPSEEGETSFLSPFKHDTYRAMWTANLASSFGGLIQMTGAAWMMTTISQSTDMVALVQASTALPVMLFSLASGAIADNFPKRRVMLIANFFMLVVSLLLMAAAFFGVITPWLLLGFTFLIGCGSALNTPSWQATVGDLVPRHDLASAVTLNSIGFNLSRSLAPAVGGVIIAAAGVITTFAANSLSYLGIIVVLKRWAPPTPPVGLPREDIGTAMRAGLLYVAMSPNISKVLLRGFAFGAAASAILALLPLIARVLVKGGPMDFGIMLGCFGVGGVLGAVFNSRLRATFSIETIARIGFIGFALAAFIAAASSNRWITDAVLILSGACWVITLSLFNVTVQLSAPRWVLGRALALYQTNVFAGIAGGSWLWGAIAERYDTRVALFCSAGALIAGAALGLRLPLPEQSALNLDPLNRWKEPDLPEGLTPSSGPIIINVDYKIKDEDVPEFLLQTELRRQIRLRDGARKWSLKRDLHNPEIWTMSYQFPTWVEYIRHNKRMTHADADVGESILALHVGPQEPVIRRMIERQTNWSPDRPIKPPLQVSQSSQGNF